ncbi:MAG: 4-hydroxy-3-methylbut-2-enyl diphosphate reductase [Kiritimatiellae bacterium]|nr:4-hydroxy-3-methylbut-2-enyl diphosphate reductase [Kiritimatiellia bacterium]
MGRGQGLAEEGLSGRPQIVVLEPHGFCAGVAAALRKARAFCAAGGAFCLHEIVHNPQVVESLRRSGLKFVDDIDEVPEGGRVLFSAHGASPQTRERARRRGLEVVDATCPFVERVHEAARAFASRGLKVVVAGYRNHAETAGILGEASGAVAVSSAAEAEAFAASLPRGEKIGVVSQTTMDARETERIVAALSERLEVEAQAQVCGATKERQDAVRAFDGDLLVVLGGANSSNTRRLCEVARCRAARVATLGELEALDIAGARRIGVTSGASTPEDFLREAVRVLGDMV